MATKDYNFQYTPLTGRLPGKSFVKQTEQAINELAGIVNEGSAQVEVITNLANTANENSEEALEKANEALETAGRVYITLPNLDDADSYFDSQLYYFANSYSTNLPVQDTGFLEVKTNDTKTACEQVFIADLTGLCYFRHGTITSAEVGSETVYTVTWSTWSIELASEDYVQGELLNYLPLSGGSVTGDLSVTGTITGDLTGDVTGDVTGDLTGNVTGNADTATNAMNDGLGNNIANTYQPAVVGAVIAFAGSTSPAGWLLCDGSAVSRTDYAALFAVIGTTYGAGDGSTTFTLPNLIDKFVQGNATSGTVKNAGLPNITGTMSLNNTSTGYSVGKWDGDGALQPKTVSGADVWVARTTSGNVTERSFTIDASRSSSIYGNSTTVQPPALTMKYIIKY